MTGHFNLWKVDIHHGDISLWNLMWNDQKKAGVLNDFDLIRALNVTSEELEMLGINGIHDPLGVNGERTGTIPFMALDLLTKEYFAGKVPRRYRHDAESFIWVLTWLCLYGVTDEQDKSLAMWKTGDYQECKKERSSFLFDTSRYQCRHRFDVLWNLTRKLLKGIAMDRMQRDENEFVEPTSTMVYNNILNHAKIVLPEDWNLTDLITKARA